MSNETLGPSVDSSTIGDALAALVRRHLDQNPANDITSKSLPDVATPWANTTVLGVFEYISVALLLADKFQSLPPERFSGYRDGRSPRWSPVDVRSERLSYPTGVSGLFLAGELLEFPVVLQLATSDESDWKEDSNLIRIHTSPEHSDAAQEWVAQVRAEADRLHNIFRGRVVELKWGGGVLLPSITAVPAADLDDVVVSAAVRNELTKNVMRHVAAREALAKVGIGSNRGVLLWGPPGTGKTSLVRGCVAELAGEVTVLVPNADAVVMALSTVYQEASRLAPCLVVLEDVDVVAADRHGRDAGLAGFLAALDGVVSDPEKLIVTIATTNNPAGIDEAAKRPGRIDRLVEVPLPDEEMRAAILKSYLAKMNAAGITVSVGEDTVTDLARSSEGASGALLREVVRRSLLEAGGTVDSVIEECHLLVAAEEIGYRVERSTPYGQYL